MVLAEGRISLKVLTEVSELSTESARSLKVRGVSPSLRWSVRRADTTLEIPSRGSFAMAGMIQDQTKSGRLDGIPS